MIQRILVPLLLGAALASGAFLLYQRLQQRPAPPAATPTPTAVPTPTEPAPVAAAPESKFRLAGTAVGDPTSYAAIELPDGTSHLYRSGDEIPNLGRLQDILPDRVVVQGPTGAITMSLKPAATPTSDRRRLKSDPRPTPEVPVDSGDILPESAPSDAPDPQAF